MDNFWKLEEQNTFSTGVQSTKILYQSNLNILLIVTKNGEIVVVDVTTGAELHKSLLTGNFCFILDNYTNVIGAEIVDCVLANMVSDSMPEITWQSVACVLASVKKNLELRILATCYCSSKPILNVNWLHISKVIQSAL